MSAVREAVVLPAIFLTVALVGGLQIDARVALMPPSLFSLVLATLLFAALIRGGVVAPDRLLHSSRSALQNANGAVVLVSAFVAAAQILSMVIPRSGLPLFFADLFLLVLLVNALVSVRDRVHLLRSLAVMLGSALLLKFVLLASLSAPADSRTARLLFALFDAATFGSIAQEAQAPAAGYVAFAAVALFLIGVSLLPAPPQVRTHTALSRRD